MSLTKQETGQILPVGHSLPIPDTKLSQNQINIYRHIYLCRINFKSLPYLGQLKGSQKVTEIHSFNKY